MKKRISSILVCIVLWLCTACMVLFCCDVRGLLPGVSDAGDLSAVMTEEGYSRMIDNRVYLTNRAGNYICVRLENPGYGAVTDIQLMDAGRIIPTHFHFSMIKKGMTPEQVTALVGIPFAPTITGISGNMYEATDGTVYAVYWDTDRDSGKIVTASGAGQIESMNGPGTVRSTQLRAWIWNHITAVFLLAAIYMTAYLRKKSA